MDGDRQRIEAEGWYEGLTLEGAELPDADARGATLLDPVWSAVEVPGGDWEATTWRGAQLRSCRFLGTGLARSQWVGSSLQGCVLAGCELLRASLRGVRLVDCRLDSVNLRSAVLEDVVFDSCVLGDLDLGGARLRRVSFPGCRIERLDLTRADLAQVDLRGSSLHLSRGADRLRGAVVDHAQLLDLAPALAALVGLQVRAAGEDPGSS